MKTPIWMSTLLLSFALASCGKGDTPKLPEAPSETVELPDWEASIAGLRALGDEDFSLDGATEADLAAINAALPALVSVSWDTKTFDEASGATVFSGFRITIASEPEFGIAASEARVWGLESDFIAARLRGERLDEAGPALSRMEMSDITYFGLAGVMNMLFDQMAEKIDDDGDHDLDVGFDTFESSIGSMVISNVSLRPFEYIPVSDTFFEDIGVAPDEMSEEDAEQTAMALNLMRLGQQSLAVARAMSMEDYAAYDTQATIVMHQPGIDQSMDVSYEFYGGEDVVGLDIGRAVIVNVAQSQSTVVTDETGDLAEAGFEDGLDFDQAETTAFISYQGLKLDKLAGYLARGEFPMLEEKDLISLGVWEVHDYALDLNEGDIFEVAQVNVDASTFAWLIPEDFSVEMKGAELGSEAIARFAVDFIPVDSEDPEGADFMDKMGQAIDTLDEYGLSTIPFDTTFEARWSEATGTSAFSWTMDSKGFGEGLASLDITLPNYEAIQAAYDSGDFETAFEDAFQQAFLFSGARFYEADDGGYDKLFGYAGTIAKLYPDEGWGAMLGNMTVEQMRQFIATMIRTGKPAAAEEVPQAAEWLESFAKYYETAGGSIEILVDPTMPITVDYFETLDQEAEPQEIVEDLGISVTYAPE